MDIEGLEELVPPKIQPSAAKKPAAAEQPKKELSKKEAALEKANQQYRVPCPACGTPQYVTVAQQGKTIKCPDCFLDFKIPPPPPGWKPSNKPVVANWTTNLAEESAAETEKERSRSRASADEYLRKAEQELSEEEIEGMYGGDFDTAGFMQRTFGFMFDAMAMAQIMAYALVFALLFALANWCAGKFAEGDKGVALVGVLAVPLLMMMAAFPMFSGAITLLESVANGEKKVREWPGFNIFEHMGELLVFAMAVAVSAFPGFLLGAWLGSDGGMGWLAIAGALLSTFLLFPLVLLSMLDNGSIVNPFSTDVLKSITLGMPSWAVYYFKTLIAFFAVFVAWAVLFQYPILAALGGAMLPLLVFFTSQQLGVLAFDIGEHLSIALPEKGEEQEEEAK